MCDLTSELCCLLINYGHDAPSLCIQGCFHILCTLYHCYISSSFLNTFLVFLQYHFPIVHISSTLTSFRLIPLPPSFINPLSLPQYLSPSYYYTYSSSLPTYYHPPSLSPSPSYQPPPPGSVCPSVVRVPPLTFMTPLTDTSSSQRQVPAFAVVLFF